MPDSAQAINWTVAHAAGGGRFEEVAGYSRAKRVGPFVFVSGTTAVEPSGRVHAPGDAAAQTRYTLGRIQLALEAVGCTLEDVVRVRGYLTDIADAGAFAQVHGELLGASKPALTVVEAGLATPGLVVEIEVDAIAVLPDAKFGPRDTVDRLR